jgi:probable phosphoglycerate mutase
MPKPLQIWLIRHGETEWTLTGQHTGREDLPLTARGEEEARQAAVLLAGVEFDGALISTLQRARRTAELAGRLEAGRLEPLVQEWDYGRLNGRTFEDIRGEYPGWSVWRGPIPGGETIEDVAERADIVLERLLAEGGTFAVFSHGHFLRILTARFLDLDPRAAKHFALATAALSVLGFDNGFPAILRWNVRSAPAGN